MTRGGVADMTMRAMLCRYIRSGAEFAPGNPGRRARVPGGSAGDRRPRCGRSSTAVASPCLERARHSFSASTDRWACRSARSAACASTLVPIPSSVPVVPPPRHRPSPHHAARVHPLTGRPRAECAPGSRRHGCRCVPTTSTPAAGRWSRAQRWRAADASGVTQRWSDARRAAAGRSGCLRRRTA